MNKKSALKGISTICAILIAILIFPLSSFAANEKDVTPSSQTTQMTSEKSATSLNVGVTPMSLSKPTSGTALPYSGSFSGVNGEIFSNYYFFTNGANKFYVDWNVTFDTQTTKYFHINVYQAGTNKFVLSTEKFASNSYTGWYTTTFSNLSTAYNYYISFVNDGPIDYPGTLSGDFTARLN